MATEYIQVPGKCNVYIGYPSDSYAALEKVGENINETQLAVEPIMHNVAGDQHGGQEGAPIEMQALGYRVRGQLQLSKWNPEVRRKIERHNLYATDGAVLDSEIGSLLLRDRSFRILLKPAKDNPILLADAGAGAVANDDYFVRNFVCCTIESAIACGVGTKFSVLSFAFTAHRAPDDHPLAPAANGSGLIWNYNETGIPV